MKKFLLLSFLSLALITTGCNTTDGWGDKQTLGTGLGAVLGGVAGSQVGSGSGRLWATGAGVLLGTLIGSEIGSSLDKADRAYMQQAQREVYSAPVGQAISWNNPQSGNSGSYTPVRDGVAESGAYCRQYEQTVVIDGRHETAYGTACQRPDGRWEII
jgi:surface antigen